MKSNNTFSTRRGFLKTASSAGVALAGGLTATQSHSSEPVPHLQPCSFSELPADFIYLNSGTEGSMPDCVLTTFKDALSQWAGNPTTSYELDPVLGKRQELNRSKVARFLGVEPNNICLTDNTTMGCAMTLMGLNFRAGDKVVTTNHEHNAIRSPLQVLQERQGLQVETRSFPSPGALAGMTSAELIDTLLPNISSLRDARALCVSHVYPTTGVRLPLGLLRQKADELNIRYLVVDGAQAMGMVDLGKDGDSLENCDFYACPGHKWLNGPPSTGVLYIKNAGIRPPEFYPSISQRMGKYLDCGENASCDFPMAQALQVRGCSNTPGFAAMVRAMEFVQDNGGSSRVEKHILGLSRKVKDMLASYAPLCMVSPHDDPALASGLTVFFPFKWEKPQTPLTDRKTAEWVVNELLKKNIQVRFIGIPNPDIADRQTEYLYAIRVSTAYFNSAENIETFKKALRKVLTHLG